MFLYHGTTKAVADKALVEGLKPRGKKKSEWRMASNRNAVYLTDAYAPYFAFNAASNAGTDDHAVIVIDTKALNIGHLMPDEDALEQASRNSGPSGTMIQRTRHFRDNQSFYASQGWDWLWSLKVLGTCCYHGTIPPEAIVKVVSWNRETTRDLVFVFDPTISLMNYQFVGSRYRYLMQEFAKVNSGHQLTEMDRFGMGNMNAILSIFDTVDIKENPNYVGRY